MAAGASVTWTNCSVLFEVTWDKTKRVREDVPMSAQTLGCVRQTPMSARTQPSVRADMGVRADASPSPPLPSPPPSPPPSPLLSTRTRKNNFQFLFFLVVVAGLEREKQFTIYNFRFSIFDFRFLIPELLELRGLRGRSREKKKVFSA
jgi:hypothetical protein